MKRPSVKITGWLCDMLQNLVTDLRNHTKESPNDLCAKRWLTQAEATHMVAKQVFVRATQEKAEWKAKKGKHDSSNAV